MAWTWCPDLGCWATAIGPVPDGYSYPITGSNAPDLSSLSDPLGPSGGIYLFSAAADFVACDFDFGVTQSSMDYGPGFPWAPGGPDDLNGTVPADAWMFVVVGGPDYADTDPAPTWDPALVLTPAPPFVDIDGQADVDLALSAELVPPALLAGQVDVEFTLPAELMFSAPSDLETWDADRSQRLNVDLRLVVGLQVPPALVAVPAVFSNTGPTGPTGVTGPTGALP